MDEKARKINAELMEELKKESSEILYRFDTDTLNAAAVNRELLLRVVRENSDTEYGRRYGFAEIHDIDEYRRRVPLSDFEDYAPYIDRMTEKGEQNLLTAKPPVYFAGTSGTTGASKKIPITGDGLESFLTYSTMPMIGILSEFYRNTRHTDIEFGKECAIISVGREKLPCGVDYGSLSSLFMDDDEDGETEAYETAPKEVMAGSHDADMKYLHARYALAEPDLLYFSAAYIPAVLDIMNYIRDNHEILVRDIREGRIDPGIRMPAELRKALEDKLKPDPARAEELGREFARGFDPTVMKRIWPRLAAVCTVWAGNFLPYAKKLQQYSGRTVPYYTMGIVASEGVFAIARHPFDWQYCMVPSTCFYEFIPADGPEEARPETLLLDELEEGREYELVITNQSGLYRYRMGDVVRAAGYYNETPMVEFVYRKNNLLSLAGEKVTESQLAAAVQELERMSGIRITDFCVHADQSGKQGRYEVFLEPESSVPPDRAEECAKILDEELGRASMTYEKLKSNIGEPRVVFLRPETFRLFRESRARESGTCGNQIKTVRVLTRPAQVRFFEDRKAT